MKEHNVIIKSNLPKKTCPLCSTAFISSSKYCDYCRKRLRQLYDCKRSAKYGSKIQQISSDRKKYFEKLSDEEFYEQVAKPIVDNKIADWESHYFNNLEEIIYKLTKGIALDGHQQRIVNGIINRG